jgi:hypothetical protein
MATNPKPDDPTLPDEDPDYTSADVQEAQPDHTKVGTGPENLKGILQRINEVVSPEHGHLHVGNPTDRKTQFDELVVASETTSFSLGSQWNALQYRNDTSTSGSASVTNNTQGEYQLNTGSTSGSTASLVSKEAGVYEPGTTAIIGLGTRQLQAQSSLVTDDDIKWGYFDAENGFGFGVDSSD